MTKKKHPWGRPTKMNEEVVRKLEEIFMIDGTVSEACSQAWIGTTTYYERIEKNQEFADKMKRAQKYPFIIARKTLIRGIKEWDAKSAIEYLKRRDNRYSDKVQQENTNIDTTNELTDEQKKAIASRFIKDE